MQDDISYPYNRMKHAYCPRDEFELIRWAWQFWLVSDVSAYIDYLSDDSNWES